MNEKERVYAERDTARAELRLVKRKCERLRKQINELEKATTAREAAIARSEATEYRKALSNIVHRIDSDQDSSLETLKAVAASALLLRGLRPSRRKQVEQAREGVSA